MNLIYSNNKSISEKHIRVYDKDKSVSFLKTKESFGGLSNMAPGFPLDINGVKIKSSEALYQACRYPHLPDVQKTIIEQQSPMTAKMKSKAYLQQSREDWAIIQVKIMRWCLQVKLAQNYEKFSELLLQTGESFIVELSYKDKFWGATPNDDGQFVGMNVLGRLLMQLREQVKVNSFNMSEVAPPEVKNFLLLSEPIGSIAGTGLYKTQGFDLFSVDTNKAAEEPTETIQPDNKPKVTIFKAFYLKAKRLLSRFLKRK